MLIVAQIARLPMLRCLSCLIWLVFNVALVNAQDPLVGKRVVVIRENAPLEVSGKEIAKASECSVFSVKAVQGNFLWIESEQAYLRRDDVVPFEDAIDHYTRQLETNRTAQNYWNRAQIWRLKGELDIALGDMNDAIRLNPENSGWFLSRGILWDDKKEYDKAISDYSEAIRLDPGNGEAYNNRGNVWSTREDYGKAIADYDEALKHKDATAKTGFFSDTDISGGDSSAKVNSRSLTLSNRGSVKHKQGDYTGALADFEEAIRLDPKYEIPRAQRRRVWTTIGQWEKVIAELNEEIRDRPKDGSLYSGRAFCWFRLAELDKAMADYQEAIRLNPQDQWDRYGLAEVNLAQRNQDAIEGFQSVMDAQGWNGELTVYAVVRGYQAASLMGKTERAELFLKDSQGKLQTKWPYAVVQFYRGELDEMSLMKLCRSNGEETEARCNLAMYHLLQGRGEDARTHFQWVRDHGDKNYFEYGMAMSELKRLDGESSSR